MGMAAMTHEADELEDPDLTMAGLKLWVHGRQFPDQEDYWDGNWLDVTARCVAEGATVSVSGPILHASELQSLHEGLKRLHANPDGEVILDCLEPNLGVELKGDRLGGIRLTLRITPDNIYQDHIFYFDIDQSYLPSIIRDCKTILDHYPIKGAPG
jgi:hypothetical protein